LPEAAFSIAQSWKGSGLFLWQTKRKGGETVEIRKGRLIQFCGSWGSGLGYLEIEDSETGVREHVPCDNGATIRALEAAFGSVITPGHAANGDGYKGREVYWSYDELGLVLEGFTPVEDAPPELADCYKTDKGG